MDAAPSPPVELMARAVVARAHSAHLIEQAATARLFATLDRWWACLLVEDAVALGAAALRCRTAPLRPAPLSRNGGFVRMQTGNDPIVDAAKVPFDEDEVTTDRLLMESARRIAASRRRIAEIDELLAKRRNDGSPESGNLTR